MFALNGRNLTHENADEDLNKLCRFQRCLHNYKRLILLTIEKQNQLHQMIQQ